MPKRENSYNIHAGFSTKQDEEDGGGRGGGVSVCIMHGLLHGP